MGLGIEDVIGNKREEVRRLVEQYGARNVRVFGSVARGDANPDSDIDFLVDDLENTSWGGGSLLMALQTLLGRRVDLLGVEDLHPALREKILKESTPI